ncbi:organic cation/carnitine transporter 3-like [Gastrolobium bilobum]|uniref:organic cation/carnitine transporter 3-like n=1 Tax=Gastrolobium bilobum TaxID=150636 RepID=UPI002AB09EFE|nr:organic cation/carnitine transporter 3-like [Gastrolobium bilobum]
MVDTTQLLLKSNSSDPVVPPQDEEHHSSISSTIEECLGELNWTQFLQAVLVSFSWFFDGQQTFITIFTDEQPSWHCTEQGGDSCNTSNMCSLPKGSWAWDGPTKTSMISEWGLECENSFITGLPASMFFMGCLIGGLVLATLADTSLGRKNMVFFSCLLMSLSSFIATFSINVWMYSVLKFFSGFGRSSIGTSALVLVSELVAKRWRGRVGVLGFFFFSTGFLTVPAMAYANRDSSWRNLYLWTSLPAILYCVLVHLLVPESPRWLLTRGRKEEALKVLKSITSITESNLNLAISGMSLEKEVWNIDFYSALKILMQKKWSSRRLYAFMAMGLGIGLVYYGMPLALGNLSFNLYLSVTFNALSEIPSTLLAYILLDKFNRRSVLFILTILSGMSSILAIMEGKILTRLQIVFELISFFSACTACDIVLIYSTELFPTSVRNSALSLVRQAVALGGVFCPMLVAAGRNNKFICYGVFGLAIGCGGMLGVFLPETKGQEFCDTMDEEESKEKV